jgi:hypothetical protein
MCPISQSYYQNQAFSIVDYADIITLSALIELRRITNRWIDDPDLMFDQRWNAFVNDNSQKWETRAPELLVAIMATSYLKGINVQDSELLKITTPRPPDNPIPTRQPFLTITTGIAPVSQAQGASVLSSFPKHLQAYASIESAYLGEINRTFGQILRSQRDMYRQMSAEVLTPAFKAGDVATRRDLAQRMMDDFGRRGITGITYANGARVPLDVYSNMVARSASQTAAMQASANRLQERGYDLVRVNQYAGASDLCAPWQGGVYSLSGRSTQYPSMQEATFDGNTGLWHPNSYIKDMEAYTTNGWKNLSELDGTERVLSLNPDSIEPEWCGIAKLHSYKHKGKMVHLTSNSFDLCVTPDHDLFIGYKGRDKGIKQRVTKYRFCKADEAVKRACFSQLRCVNWTGTKQGLPIRGVTHVDFAKLLAWYISDGYCEKPNGKWTKVCISKSKEPHLSKMKPILEAIGFKYSNERFWNYNHEWAQYFSQFGKAHEKYLPDWIKNERKVIIGVFIDAYLLGDGSQKKNTWKFDSIDKSVFTTSKRLADDLGECILKSGHYPSFGLQESKGIPVKHHNGIYKGNHDIWRISINNIKESYYCNSPSNKDMGLKSDMIDYDDMVYCVTLEKNHVLWVRRNGKTTWSGNCGHSYSAYIPGLSESLGALSDDPLEQDILNEMGEAKGNEFIYKTRQEQRAIENNIRKYKRREAVSLDPGERDRNNRLVKGWQERQRELIKENPFLRRDYKREQI